MRQFTDDDFLRDTDVCISDGRIVIKCRRGRWVEAGFCLETVDKRARETYFRYLNNGAYDSPIDPEKDEKMRRAMDLTDLGLGDSHRIPAESAGNGSPDSHIRDIRLPTGMALVGFCLAAVTFTVCACLAVWAVVKIGAFLLQ